MDSYLYFPLEICYSAIVSAMKFLHVTKSTLIFSILHANHGSLIFRVMIIESYCFINVMCLYNKKFQHVLQ